MGFYYGILTGFGDLLAVAAALAFLLAAASAAL